MPDACAVLRAPDSILTVDEPSLERSAITDPVIASILDALSRHSPRVVEVAERRKAAVALLLFDRDDEPWIVLTRRTDKVRTHKGEISFPGGAMDAEDESLWATAKRETHEELGIDPAEMTYLGELDDYPTFASGFIVRAFVAAVAPADYEPSDDEIDEVIELPLRRLVEAHRVEMWEHEGIRFPMNIYDVDGHRVWGVTAFILSRFIDVVWPSLRPAIS